MKEIAYDFLFMLVGVSLIFCFVGGIVGLLYLTIAVSLWYFIGFISLIAVGLTVMTTLDF